MDLNFTPEQEEVREGIGRLLAQRSRGNAADWPAGKGYRLFARTCGMPWQKAAGMALPFPKSLVVSDLASQTCAWFLRNMAASRCPISTSPAQG